MTLSEQELLSHIARQPRQTAGYKQLVHELGLKGNDRRLLGQMLRRMVKLRQLTEPTRDRFAIPPAKPAARHAPGKDPGKNKDVVAGILRMHPDGFGFVIPAEKSLRDRLQGDIFIPPPATGAAMHGDQVLVHMGPIRADGRAEGRIVSVVAREHETVVGVFHFGSHRNYVVPIDQKISGEIIIPRGLEIPPGGVTPKSEKPTPHRVLGEEVHQRRDHNSLEGQVVDVEITDWPSPTQEARGRVIEILGHEADFGVDVEIIIRKYHIPHRFPPSVLDEAQQIAPVITARELEGRRDFRALPIVTIDGETARDFDDAVHVRKLPRGHWELQVHIADVAHYVTPHSSLDNEALFRGTSVYFPDRAVPMLPVELSTDICSLRPHLDRLVMSCVMEIDPQGELTCYELSEGLIRSAERMTYTDVNLVLENDAGLRRRYAPLVENFELMRELALALNRRRVRRGSIDFDLPEPVIEFDEQGLMQGVSKSERNIAHRIIEEFMLAANECVATFLEQRGVASVYRIHEKPEARKVYDFETIAASFGYSLGVGALPIRRMTMKSDRRQHHGSGRNPREIELPQEVHITPRMYQKLTQKIAGKPEERILSYLMLRSLKQARYSDRNEGHFALAAPTYTHFTSPIRRYPDLLVHRILKAVLRDKAEQRGSENLQAKGTMPSGESPSPWSKRGELSEKSRGASHGQSTLAHSNATDRHHHHHEEHQPLGRPIPEADLHEMADSSSQNERRAADAERELMEWKKLKFMQDRLGEEFAGLVVSVTKYGLFVELEEMFIEGLVPLAGIPCDRFTYRENTKQIIGERTKKIYSLGDRVKVMVDRIDRVQRKLQFALLEDEPPQGKKKRTGQ